MDAFTSLTSSVLSLPMSDVDTDMIIPASFLTSVSRGGFGDHVFQRLRDQDPEFPFCKPEARTCNILLVRSNFGCGSSREHAVWALKEWGIQVIIGESFADIFASNSAKNGLVLIRLSSDEVDYLQAAAESSPLTVTVDLPQQTIHCPDGKELSFPFDSFRKHCITEGLDDVDYILSASSDIAAFREKQTQTLVMNELRRNHE